MNLHFDCIYHKFTYILNVLTPRLYLPQNHLHIECQIPNVNVLTLLHEFTMHVLTLQLYLPQIHLHNECTYISTQTYHDCTDKSG